MPSTTQQGHRRGIRTPGYEETQTAESPSATTASVAPVSATGENQPAAEPKRQRFPDAHGGRPRSGTGAMIGSVRVSSVLARRSWKAKLARSTRIIRPDRFPLTRGRLPAGE